MKTNNQRLDSSSYLSACLLGDHQDDFSAGQIIIDAALHYYVALQFEYDDTMFSMIRHEASNSDYNVAFEAVTAFLSNNTSLSRSWIARMTPQGFIQTIRELVPCCKAHGKHPINYRSRLQVVSAATLISYLRTVNS